MSIQHKREYGQSLVLVALLMIGMLAFLGLILDGGYAYVTRRWGQDAADAAALAGTRELALQKTETVISSTISTFALANRTAGIADVTAYYIDKDGNNLFSIPHGSVPTLATGVRVTTTLRFQPYFISLLIGRNPIPIPSVAAAQSGVASAGAMLSPTTLPFPCAYNPLDPNNCSLVYGRVYTLTGNSELPGGFQWVIWPGPGITGSTGDLADYLTLFKPSPLVMADPLDIFVPYSSPEPSPSPWIPSNSGLAFDTKVQCALDAWINLSNWGTCNYTGASLNWGNQPSEPKWITPVFDVKKLPPNPKYHVIMFAEFQLLGYWAGNGAKQCNWVGAPSNPRCTMGQLPDYPNSGWELRNCNAINQTCILGKFLREVENLPIIPGKCNTNGLNVCAVGLSQ